MQGATNNYKVQYRAVQKHVKCTKIHNLGLTQHPINSKPSSNLPPPRPKPQCSFLFPTIARLAQAGWPQTASLPSLLLGIRLKQTNIVQGGKKNQLC